MVEKIPLWERENDQKNSGMTVKIPAWERENVPVHGNFSTAASVA
jgi:hypothetical protein